MSVQGTSAAQTVLLQLQDRDMLGMVGLQAGLLLPARFSYVSCSFLLVYSFMGGGSSPNIAFRGEL